MGLIFQSAAKQRKKAVGGLAFGEDLSLSSKDKCGKN
jgi:hypothetical protein